MITEPQHAKPLLRIEGEDSDADQILRFSDRVMIGLFLCCLTSINLDQVPKAKR